MASAMPAPCGVDGYRVSVQGSAAAAPLFAAALEGQCQAVSWFAGDGPGWRIEGYARSLPDRAALAAALGLAAAAAGCPPPEPRIEPLAARDWLADNRSAFPPLRIGRFRVHAGDLPGAGAGGIALAIASGAAFGTGRHASTAGCLTAIDTLAPRRPERALDLGCGSGILAVAIARLWRVPVIAADIDPRAVGVARATARQNRVGALVRTVCADGYAAPVIRAGGPYELIVCNILARPIRRMAGTLAAHLRPGGIAVLSGFVAADGPAVLAVHRAHGLCLRRRITLGGWQTLILARAEGR